MNVYRIHYPNVMNMGDRLNKDMIEELFHVSVEQSSVPKSDLSAIGSGLGCLFWSRDFVAYLRQLREIPFASIHHIWGTGFVSDTDVEKLRGCLYKELIVHSLRGDLSRVKLEKKLKRKLQVPLGDGGLLVDRWVGKNIPKKYAIGVIPHFREQDHRIVHEMKDYYGDDITIINLIGNPKDVVKQIAECETILSSSLHGLIVADSFHIPNKHILLYPYGMRLMGDGFKFRDYYSAFGLDDTPVDINHEKVPTIAEIKKDYKMDHDSLEERKDLIMQAFPVL